MIPVSEYCPVVVVDGTSPILAAASTITGTAYLRMGEIGEPGGVAVVFTDPQALDRVIQSLTECADGMRRRGPAAEPRPVLQVVPDV